MGSLSFYRFKQKMITQCHRKKRYLHIESDACTTKACGLCGKMKKVGVRTYMNVIVDTKWTETSMVRGTYLFDIKRVVPKEKRRTFDENDSGDRHHRLKVAAHRLVTTSPDSPSDVKSDVSLREKKSNSRHYKIFTPY